MSELARIAELSKGAHEGGAWHGPAVREVLRGITARQAASRPIPGAHSIWELVLHMTTWTNVVRQRLEGKPIRGLPPEEDWPAVGDESDQAWTWALAALEEAHERLLTLMAGLSDERLEEVLPGANNEIWSNRTTLHGIIHHDLYHLGQIALLKKAIG